MHELSENVRVSCEMRKCKFI